MKPAPPKVVFVVDDDELVRRSLQRLFLSAGYKSETYDSAEGYLSRDRCLNPACLVLDLQMPGLNGFALQDALNDRGSHEGVVFITGHGDVPACARALKSGAVDFLMKPFGDNELLAAVDQALVRSAGALQVTNERQMAEDRLSALTPREVDVLRYVIAGLMNKEIAAELGTSEKTVKVHRGRVMEKLHFNSVAELVRFCGVAGIEPLQPQDGTKVPYSFGA
ncbi:MAG: response regulator transcription factor [Verrucomicrobium sp.]|nr:response regulator [Verrucomicrobium sp.]